MGDLKPLVPRWRQERPSRATLLVGNAYAGHVIRLRHDWCGFAHDGVHARFLAEAEARAWVEAQLYGEAPQP